MADDPWGIDQTASDYGFDPQFLRRVIKVESGGNPNNRTGSYKGLLQLSDQEFNANGGGNIYDPVDNLRAGAKKLAAERDAFEAKYGRPPTPTDIYLIHNQGAGGYAQHLANPEAPAWQNMLNTGEGRQKGERWAKRAIWGNIPDQLKQQYGSVDNVSSNDFIGDWRNKIEGDIPYIEARASGSPAGLPFQAGGLGAELASGSPAGMPVQAADDFSAVASMRGPRMADEAPGLLASLAGQQQQGGGGIGGLLGSLNPEKMAYLAMIAKGLNPYTDVDPTKMLALAQSSRENALKLAQQQAEHAADRQIRQGHLNLSTSAEKRAQDEYNRKQAESEAEQQAYRDLLARRGVAGTGAAPAGGAVPYLGNPFGAAPAASDAGAPGAEGQFGATSDSGAEGALGGYGQTSAPAMPNIPFAGGVAAPPGVPDFRGAPAAAAAPEETGGMTRQNIEDFLSRFPNAKSAPQLRAHLEKLDAREEARGKPARELAYREELARKLNIPEGSKAWQQMVTEGKVSRPEISAGDAASIKKAEDELVGQRNTLSQLQEAATLTPKSFEGYGAELRGGLASRIPERLRPAGVDFSGADATARLTQILNSEGIRDMSRTMKGATSDREMQKWLSFAADVSLPIKTRQQSLQKAISFYEDEIKTRETRIDQLRTGDYYKPTGGQSGRSGGANAPAADPLSIR
jgi:hypothetical protein